MGLDIAEFAIAVEETFQIEFLEDDFPTINTLEELIASLERKTAEAPHSQSEADRVFREGFLSLQRLFSEELGVDISQLTPETEMAPLLKPLSRRRRIWKKVRKEFSSRIPVLYGKTYVEWGSGLCVFIGFFVGLFVTIGWDHNEWIIVRGIIGLASGTLVGLLLFIMGLFLFLPLFSTIPRECRTLGGLAKAAVATKISLDPNGQVWNRESIEKEVLQIVHEQTGLPLEKISLTEKFVYLF